MNFHETEGGATVNNGWYFRDEPEETSKPRRTKQDRIGWLQIAFGCALLLASALVAFI